ncbi:hypothetical protein BBJ28_00001318 [Nothophytophthora sp. Chile5]|nr:hypothetical protein BBJ28_00001318 [Nothophytophthora sp. Chile5]
MPSASLCIAVICARALSLVAAGSVLPDVIVPLDIDETSIAAGIEHSCAIQTQSFDDVGGRVVCWGVDNGGQSSPPSMDKTVECWGMRSGVTAAPTDIQFDELTLGWNHGCGIRFEDGGVQCWGDRGSNRLEVPTALL